MADKETEEFLRTGRMSPRQKARFRLQRETGKKPIPPKGPGQQKPPKGPYMMLPTNPPRYEAIPGDKRPKPPRVKLPNRRKQ